MGLNWPVQQHYNSLLPMAFTNSHEVEDQNEFSWFLKGLSLDDYLKKHWKQKLRVIKVFISNDSTILYKRKRVVSNGTVQYFNS